ncbi:MAG: carbohydrate ABC transporter permease [Chloroflexi bacterium]|jgi:multiple sugar transport system permease protein|nr:carbohydrate ABC transporter permease [Chloroflexota bacterium]
MVSRTRDTVRVARANPFPLRLVGRLLLNALLLLLSLLALVPFWWMMSGGFKSLGDLFVFPPRFWPTKWSLDGYQRLFRYFPFARNFMNSVVISVLSTFGNLLSSSLAAFAFARMRFKGKGFLFMLFLSTLMVPGIVYLIPQFMIFRSLHWINTLLPLIVPSFFSNAFSIFLLRQFFSTLPAELEDSGKIDGANWPRIYYSISLPLIKPALVTLGLFAFMGSWNDLLHPIIYLSKLEQLNLTAASAYLRTSYHSGENQNVEMAAATLTVIPVLAIFVFVQRYIVNSLVFSGLKG